MAGLHLFIKRWVQYSVICWERSIYYIHNEANNEQHCGWTIKVWAQHCSWHLLFWYMLCQLQTLCDPKQRLLLNLTCWEVFCVKGNKGRLLLEYMAPHGDKYIQWPLPAPIRNNRISYVDYIKLHGRMFSYHLNCHILGMDFDTVGRQTNFIKVVW